jgi:regulator of sirC expression with transglutaminase-like and TPR domain
MNKFKNYFVLFFLLLISFLGHKIFDYISLKTFKTKLTNVLPANEKTFDFTKTIINISSVFDPYADSQWVENEIYRMADDIKQRIGGEANSEYIIKIFNDYFFNVEKFSFNVNFKNKKNTYSQLMEYNSIQNALKSKKSICLTISLIYLMIGDILHLPLYGVLIPGHIYVRYKEKGKSGINIETTFNGYEYYGYMNMTGLDIYDNHKNIYGNELSNYQVIGAYLNNLGSSLLSIGELQKAEILLVNSLKYLPSISEPYINLGMLYEESGKPEIALKYYLNAIELNPQNDLILTKIGILFFNQLRLIKAQEYLEKAVKMNKENKEASDFLKKIEEKKR